MLGSIPDPVDPCSWGKSTLLLWPGSLERQGRQPLGEYAWAYFHLIVSISSFLTPAALMPLGLGCVHSGPWGVILHEDMARRETNRGENERQRLQEQKERLQGIAQATVNVGGGGGRALLS
jgi:hypothetical protein